MMKVLTLAALVLLSSITALAHDPGLSAAEVQILADRIVVQVSFAPVDLDRLQHVGSNDYLAQHLLTIKRDNETLKLQNFSVEATDANSIHFILEFPNPPGAELHLSAIAFDHLPRGHKQFLSVRDSEGKLL